MKDYSVKFMNCKIHFPAFNAHEVDDMVKQFYSNYAKPVLTAIENTATRRTCQQFKVTMGDRDLYYIYAIDYATAIDWALKLQTAKLNSALAVMRMSKNDYVLEDFKLVLNFDKSPELVFRFFDDYFYFHMSNPSFLLISSTQKKTRLTSAATNITSMDDRWSLKIFTSIITS